MFHFMMYTYYIYNKYVYLYLSIPLFPRFEEIKELKAGKTSEKVVVTRLKKITQLITFGYSLLYYYS